METYKIQRKFLGSNRTFVIATGRTFKQAQEHCQDPETSSSTATEKAGKARTRLWGPWFDCYTKE